MVYLFKVNKFYYLFNNISFLLPDNVYATYFGIETIQASIRTAGFDVALLERT